MLVALLLFLWALFLGSVFALVFASRSWRALSVALFLRPLGSGSIPVPPTRSGGLELKAVDPRQVSRPGWRNNEVHSPTISWATLV